MINVTGRIQWASCVEGSCLHNFITWFPWPLPNIVPSCNDFHDFNANVPKWVVGLKGPNDWRRPDISDDFRVSTLHFPISRGWSLDQPVAKHFEEERSWNRKVQSIPARVCGMNMISKKFCFRPLAVIRLFPLMAGWKVKMLHLQEKWRASSRHGVVDGTMLHVQKKRRGRGRVQFVAWQVTS